MNVGAEGHHEVGDGVADLGFLHGTQRYRDSRGARHGAKSGEIRGQHRAKKLNRRASLHGAGDEEKHAEPDPVHDNYEHEHGAECLKGGKRAPFGSHVGEHAGDVNRQERYDDFAEQAFDDIATLGEDGAKRFAPIGTDTDAEDKRGDECADHAEQGCDRDIEVGRRRDRVVGDFLHFRREYRQGNDGDEVSECAGDDGRAIGKSHGATKQATGVFRQAGDPVGDVKEDDERDGELNQLSDDFVNRQECAHRPFGSMQAKKDADDHADNEFEDHFHRGGVWWTTMWVCSAEGTLKASNPARKRFL